jgi:hypothetical protein
MDHLELGRWMASLNPEAKPLFMPPPSAPQDLADMYPNLRIAEIVSFARVR